MDIVQLVNGGSLCHIHNILHFWKSIRKCQMLNPQSPLLSKGLGLQYSHVRVILFIFVALLGLMDHFHLCVLHTMLIALGISEIKSFDECYRKGMDKNKSFNAG